MADTQATSELADPTLDGRAIAFVGSRLAGRSLQAYPGTMPASLTEAYMIQSQAIGLWPDQIAGWKVGRINPPYDSQFGTDRIVGPIFSKQVSRAGSGPKPALVFSGGFGAIEGEIVIQLGADAPAGKLDWSRDEAAGIVETAWFGVEIASSPFPGINDHGPLITISDFGNNNGLIIGREIPDWARSAPLDWRLRTLIDGVEVGASDASSIPGGPLESLRAALEICARNGHPIRRGMMVSTGAVTGVHPIGPGQSAAIEMVGLETIVCQIAGAPKHPPQPNPA